MVTVVGVLSEGAILVRTVDVVVTVATYFVRVYVGGVMYSFDDVVPW